MAALNGSLSIDGFLKPRSCRYRNWTQFRDEIESLFTRKADFLVADTSSMAVYIANNPGKIKPLFLDQPMNVFPNVMLLPPDDLRFKTVIDDTLRNIEYDGTLDAILKTYHTESTFLRNPKPVKYSPITPAKFALN